MTRELDEQQLVAGLRANSRDALAAAYDAFGAIAYGLATKLLASQSEAEDVVQESFLALWRQADRVDPERGVRSYLLQIVHNRCVDNIRRRSRRPEAELDSVAERAASSENPEAEAIALIEGEAVRGAMLALSDDQKTTVELVYFSGLTINEVASRMSVPAGTVKSRLRLAMGRLRQELST